MKTIEQLKESLYTIGNAEEQLNKVYNDAKVVDLEDIGNMLIKVQEQLQSLAKSKGFFGRITDKIPFGKKIKESVNNEIKLQQDLTKFVQDTLKHFDKKYEELLKHLSMFEETKVLFEHDIIKLDRWIVEAEQVSFEKPSDKIQLERLLTEAKSELKRKHDSLTTLVNPIILSAVHLTQNINELTPVLKNMLYNELKTMVGINSFKNAANMMVTLKESIVEIQKINVINANNAILEILHNSKTNLMTKEEMQILEDLRREGKEKIQAEANKLYKQQEETQKYINQQYSNLKSNGLLPPVKSDGNNSTKLLV